MSTSSRPSPARARWAWGVPIVLALLLLVALGTVLARSELRLTGTNSVPLRTPVVGLRQGERLCQPEQIVPAGAGRMRLFLAPEDNTKTPSALVTIRRQGGGVIERAPGRYDDRGSIDVAIDPPARRTRVDGVVCVRNTGNATIALSGILTPYGNARFEGKKLDISLTLLWFTKGKESRLAELSSVIPRVGHARIGGAWAFWVAALLTLLAMGVALTTAVREARR